MKKKIIILVIILILIGGGIYLFYLYSKKTPERLESAIENRVINGMNKIQNLAKAIYEENKEYSKVSCLHQKLTSICKELNLWLGKEPIIYSSSEAYCSYTELQPGEYYCIDSTGFAKKITTNSGETNYCDGITFACKKEEINDETVNWKTYKNEDYGFEIKYPSEWVIIKEGMQPKTGLNYYVVFADEEEIEIHKEKPAGEILCLAGVGVYNNDKDLPLYDWVIEKWGKPENIELGKISEIQINNLKGIRYEFLSMGIRTNILLSRNSKIINIQTTFDGCDNLHTIFNQMLSTFRFLE
ncbi:MAG: hypothetical protein QME57_05455 [Patescibacteria group bacterium]|nr:hypothetical protein [Patescibacteria group bacterium]